MTTRAPRCPHSPAMPGPRGGSTGTSPSTCEPWRTDAARDDDRTLGRVLARKSLLAVAGLVSVHDATWTTDRAGAARRWAGVRGDLAPALAALTAWCDGHDLPDPPALRAMLDGPLERVLDDFRGAIGLWRRASAVADRTPW